MPRKTTPKVGEALTDFLEVRTLQVAPKTLQNDTYVLQRFAEAMGLEKRVHLLTPPDVERWFLAEAKRQQASSFNKVRSRVSRFLGFCERRGWAAGNLLGEVPPRKVTKKERFRLSAAELLELPTYARTERDRALIVLAMCTALRANEIRNLRVKDVDLAGFWVRVTVTKSAIEDVMPMPLELADALRRWFVEYEADAGPLQPDWYLFPARRPGQGRFLNKAGVLGGEYLYHEYGSLIPTEPLTKVAVIIQRALVDAGHTIQPGEGAHTLRRSAARAYFDTRVNAGFDGALRETSAFLHHANSATTEGYLGITTEKLGRDRALRGQAFLSATMVESATVTAISPGVIETASLKEA